VQDHPAGGGMVEVRGAFSACPMKSMIRMVTGLRPSELSEFSDLSERIRAQFGHKPDGEETDGSAQKDRRG